MKNLNLTIACLSLLFAAASASAASLSKDLNTLGSNDAILKRAKTLSGKNEVKIVQNRAVDRDLRLELGVNYGGIAGGDPYIDTMATGFTLDFHITPQWSIGARYYQYDPTLSSEGERLYNEAEAEIKKGNTNYSIPDFDPADNAVMGVINWYPVYGKMNLFNSGIAQFDFYLLAGGGQVQLRSGSTETYTVGGGVGIWLAQHLSGRLEVRYQTYTDQVYTGPRKLDLTVATAGIGVLL